MHFKSQAGGVHDFKGQTAILPNAYGGFQIAIS
jgi:hypothetical protein